MNSLIKILTYCYILLALAGCQVDSLVNNKSLTANSSIFSYQGGNKTGAGLLTILELQKNIQEKTLELLNKQDEILCDYVELHSGPFYGIYYLVPVRNKSNQQIEKAFVYKIIDETNQQTKAFKAIVSDIIVLDKQELNRIPAYQRFLYAYPFKKWEEQGLNVSTELTDFAKKTDKKWHHLPTHELPASQARTIASFITITYELHVNNEVGEDGTIYVYGISSHDADSILLSNQCIFESYLGETVTFDFDYRTVTIRLQGDDIVTHPNLEEAISEFMVANDISFGNTFPYYYAITWQITATSVDPPENTGNTSGGSTGGGNTATPGGESGIKPPIELMNVNHYVGYIKNVRDCMANAKAILDNYGIHTYGSSDKVFKLMVEANDGIVNYGNNSEQNYQNAIDCIDRHLEAGRPIIVGVNHTLKLKRNERTTDHFIVITGRGYDESHQAPYYTYIETARYLEKATEACDTQKNRIYYTSPPPLLQDNNTYLGENPPKYQITQVRPNDGNTIGTINSK